MAAVESTPNVARTIDPEDFVIDSARTRRAAIITSVVGLAHAILLLTAYFLVRRYGPGSDPSSEQFSAFYASDQRQQYVMVAGIYLIPFAGIAFIWFSISLRMWLQGQLSRLDELFLNLSFVSGIIYVALLFCAGAALSLVALDTTLGAAETTMQLSTSFARYGSSLFLIFALRMAAMVVFTTTRLSLGRGVLPTWFVYAGFPVGLLLLLTSTLDPVLVVVFPIWLAVLAILLLQRARRLPNRPASELGAMTPSNLP